MFIIDIIYNLAILVTVSSVSGFIEARWGHKRTTSSVFQGITYGFIATLAMLNPYELSPGIIFDGRSIVLSLCGLFYGPIGGMIAGIMSMIVRIAIGGGGTLMGVSVIISSTVIGILFYYYRLKARQTISVRYLYLFGCVVHAVMLVLMIFLPRNFVWLTFQTIAISVIILYPIATVIIGKILVDRQNQTRLFNELKESEEKYRTLVQYSNDPICTVNPDETFRFVNDAYAKTFGVNAADMVGRHATSLIPQDRSQGSLDLVRQVLRTGERIESTLKIGAQHGEEKYFLVMVDAVKDEDGIILWASCFSKDITERIRGEENLKRIEERLRQSEKMEAVGQLAGGIAHDFNNVLGGIIGYADLSLRHVEKESVLERNLQQILKASDRAKLLVKQILTFSRHGNPQKSIVDIGRIVTEVIGLLKSSIPSSVIIEAYIPESLKPAYADPTQIHQILLNLATNSVQAMNKKGKLSIRVATVNLDHIEHGRSGAIAPGPYIVLEVGDTGIGMDSVTMAKAFEPFFTTKPVGEGTGMGLSVVLGIVQSHGGDIQLESEVGKGTRIRVFLPAAESMAEKAEPEIRPTVPGSEHIMFIDDEPMLVEMAETMLTSRGYSFTGMTDSASALKFLVDNISTVDLVISDQTMPHLTGIELAAEALKLRKNLPIILCTGFSSELRSGKNLPKGVQKILMKPYGSEELIASVREALDMQREN